MGQEVRAGAGKAVPNGAPRVVRRGQNLDDATVGRDHVGEGPSRVHPAAHAGDTMATVATDDTLDDVERWFRSRGIPHFIGGYSATRDVFTRALPALSVVLVLELLGALSLRWAWWVNLGVAVASLGALLVVWAVVNSARGRPALTRPDRVG